MIYWVEQRLIDWGLFIAGGAGLSGGHGTYPAYQLLHVDNDGGHGVPVSSDILQMDVIMAGIKMSRPEWFEVALWLYVSGVSAMYAADRLRCHVNTIYNRRDALHDHIKNRLTVRIAA